MTELVFVDTNVLVYSRDADEGEKQRAALAWMSLLWRERRGRTSVQVLSEYYVTVTRKLDPGLSREDAWDDVRALFSWRPQSIDPPLLDRGRELEARFRLSWWDSLVVAAAQLQGCAVLLSEDMQDGASFGGVRVRNPFRLETNEDRARYMTETPAPRHRGRGRPARRSVASEVK
jgi:predicted nucleic acid-binding protein